VGGSQPDVSVLIPDGGRLAQPGRETRVVASGVHRERAVREVERRVSDLEPSVPFMEGGLHKLAVLGDPVMPERA
jgi:hypothetical protein